MSDLAGRPQLHDIADEFKDMFEMMMFARTFPKATEFIEGMSDMLDRLREFDLDCKAEEYTDTGRLWELLDPYIAKYRPLEPAETCDHPLDMWSEGMSQCRKCGERG